MRLGFSKANVVKVEDALLAQGYILRTAKGGFKSGYCLVKNSKIVLINGFLDARLRFSALIELANLLDVDI